MLFKPFLLLFESVLNNLLTLLSSPPSLHKQVRSWLEAGLLDTLGEYLFPTQATPQGGMISPLLCHIALHGMEKLVYNYIGALPGREALNRSMASCIRYADDFVTLHPDRDVLLTVQEKLSLFLKGRGLELHPDRTRIFQTLNTTGKLGAGFQVLGDSDSVVSCG